MLQIVASFSAGCFPSFESMDRQMIEKYLQWEPLTRSSREMLDRSSRYAFMEDMFPSFEEEMAESSGLDINDPASVLKRVRDRDHLLDPMAVLGALTAKGPEMVPRLLEFIDDKDPLVQQQVIQALRNFGPDASDAVDKLEALLDDPDEYVRGAAAEALAHIDGDISEASSVLISIAGKGEMETREKALSSLWILADEPGVMDFLLNACEGKDNETRAVAMKSMSDAIEEYSPTQAKGPVSDDETPVFPDDLLEKITDIFYNGLSDKDPDIRAASASGLGSIGNPDEKIIAALLEASEDDESNVRRAALYALEPAMDNNEQVMDRMNEALNDEDMSIRETVSSILTSRAYNTKANDAQLFTMLQSKSLSARATASRALQSLDEEKLEKIIPDLFKFFNDDCPEVRNNLASAVAKSKDEKVVGLLIDALGDENEFVRATAADALGRIEPDPSATLDVYNAAEKLKNLLGDQSEFVRVKAATAYYNISGHPDEVLPILMNGMGSPDEVIHKTSLEGIEDMGPEAADAVPSLIDALGNSKSLDTSIVWALKEIGPKAEAAVPMLVKSLETRDRFEAKQIIEALGAIGGDAEIIVPALIAKLKDPSSDTRKTALMALGKFAPEGTEAIQPLIAALQDKNKFVRSNAAMSLANFGPAANDAVPALKAGLEYTASAPGEKTPEDQNLFDVMMSLTEPDFNNACAYALYRINPDDPSPIDILITNLDSGALNIRESAAEFLGDIGPDAEPAIPKLLEIIKGDANWVREAAAIAIGDIGSASDGVVDGLIDALDDEHGGLRLYAAEALGKIGPDAKRAIPALKSALRDKFDDVQINAAYALYRIDPSTIDVVDFLTKKLNNSEKGVTEDAIKALIEIGPGASAALPKLKDIVKNSRYRDIRLLAAEAIAAIEI